MGVRTDALVDGPAGDGPDPPDRLVGVAAYELTGEHPPVLSSPTSQETNP